MLSEVFKKEELPLSTVLRTKRKVPTKQQVKKAYDTPFMKNNQETFTREECQAMIEFAINQHNRNAGQISMVLGFIFMALFADGLFRVLGLIPPFMGLDVNIIQDVVDAIKDEVVKQL